MRKKRCPWLKSNNELYRIYHDFEWGRPLHDDNLLFEMIVLEGAQAGLSWETILNKRENYRKAFKDFDPKVVSKFSKSKISALLKDSGIIRNRLKIKSAITNAKVFLEIQKEFGSFDKYIWKFVNYKPIINVFKSLSDYPARTELSDLISKDMKSKGFKFIGSTIMYAYMQSVGLVQDHSQDCYLGGKRIRRS